MLKCSWWHKHAFLKWSNKKKDSLRTLLREFPCKEWTRIEIEKLSRETKSTGWDDRFTESGRSKSGRSEKNIVALNELILSQGDEPCYHWIPWEISLATGLLRSTVQRIIKHHWNLRPFKTEVTKNVTDDEILRTVT